MFAETRYDGPVEQVRLRVAGREILLARPSDPDRLLNDPEVRERNRRDDYMPYWAYLWPTSFLLAEAVGRETWAAGTEALEIGCGLGLGGLSALAAGLRVRFTDYDAEPLRFVAQSAEANGFAAGSYSTARLDWRAPPEESYGLILGADVLYERRLVPLVVNLIDRMLAPGGVALLAGPYRVATEDLGESLDRQGLSAETWPGEASDDRGELVRGTLHRITRREG